MIQDAAGLEAAALEKIYDPTFFPCRGRVVAEPGKLPGKQVCQQRLFIIPFTGGRQCLLGKLITDAALPQICQDAMTDSAARSRPCGLTSGSDRSGTGHSPSAGTATWVANPP